MTIANVSGQVATIDEVATIRPSTPPKYIHRIPDLDDSYLRIEYTIDHPIVEAAREFMKKSLLAMKEREVAKKLEDEFKRIAQMESKFHPGYGIVPEEELIHISDDDRVHVPPVPIPEQRRSPIQRRQEFYTYPTFDPDEFERFFNIGHFPVAQKSPFHQKGLHPDLLELDDPWLIPTPEPDLIQFD
ncbi:hypothetical protein M0802_012669 [Mischocyttarus mexicanus]|nr:hypothetical protein M0802_012669 [Mischocyttarus mexicanus]